MSDIYEWLNGEGGNHGPDWAEDRAKRNMNPPFEEHADREKLKDAAALLRVNHPELAKEIERAIDDIDEMREKLSGQ